MKNKLSKILFFTPPPAPSSRRGDSSFAGVPPTSPFFTPPPAPSSRRGDSSFAGVSPTTPFISPFLSSIDCKLVLISLIISLSINCPVFAESLFKTGISQNAYPMQPKSLFSSIKAKTIGDLVIVVINEEISISDNVKLAVKNSTTTEDQFSSLLNRLLPWEMFPSVDGFGGSTDVGNEASIERKMKLKDTITTQVVQVLPNGNLVIQGKKTAINSGERMDMIMSGIIDPRLLDNSGKISSALIANLQIAVVGKGTISRSDTEGTLSKVFGLLF